MQPCTLFLYYFLSFFLADGTESEFYMFVADGEKHESRFLTSRDFFSTREQYFSDQVHRFLSTWNLRRTRTICLDVVLLYCSMSLRLCSPCRALQLLLHACADRRKPDSQSPLFLLMMLIIVIRIKCSELRVIKR